LPLTTTGRHAGTLSRLTLDYRFEDAALCALRLLWSKRSPRNLLGNTLDVVSGAWRNPMAGIGAGIDSFYEYALKSDHLMISDERR
jgi:ER degradation enhancer, mannosidase alpha-like 1